MNTSVARVRGDEMRAEGRARGNTTCMLVLSVSYDCYVAGHSAVSRLSKR